LDRGADIEAQDAIGRTALTAAASSYDDKADGMRVLLERGANIEAKDKYGRTALFGAVHSAELSGHPNRVLMLLDHKANIMVRDTSGNTALTLAACETWVHPTFKLRVVKLLVDRGAEIEARNNIGETAMSCAQHTKEQALADYLEMTVMRRKLLDRSAKWHVKEGFVLYMSAFAQNPRDETLRQRIIALSGQLPEPPPIPEEARQLFTAAADQIKQAATPAALDQPIALLRKALEIAPWWSNAYYNLSRALEMRGQYDDAARQLNYYLELQPAEADAQQARAHLVVIQAEKDAADQAQARLNADNETLVKATAAEHPLQAPVDNGRLKNQQSAATNPPTRSRAGNPLPDPKLVWTDPATGLDWTKRDNAIEVDWEQAKAYCVSLRLGGAGWRLPTFGELQGIYDPSVDVPGYQGYPRLGYAVVWHVKGNLKLSGVYWSSSIGNDSENPLTFYFVNGNHFPRQFNIGFGMRVLCVRSSGE
jgi:tetratricopeptide (TPR) repeat protein